jgi:membrane protease YdiL (CAAX protease family)
VAPRICFVVVLLNSIFFVRGCDQQHNLILSLGVAVPFVDVEATEVKLGRGPDPYEVVLPAAFEGFSWPLFLVNLVAAAFVGLAILRLSRRRRAWAALWVAAVLFGSFMISMHIWMFAVFQPTVWVAYATRWVVFLGQTDDIPNRLDPRFSISIASRLYFFALFAVIYGGSSWRSVFRCRRPLRESEDGGESFAPPRPEASVAP